MKTVIQDVDTRDPYRSDRSHEPRAKGDQLRRASPLNDKTTVLQSGGAVGESELPWPY